MFIHHSHFTKNLNSHLAQIEIKRLWQIKAVAPKSILEMRAIKAGKPIITKIFRGREFSSVNELKQAFEDKAIQLNEEGYNIYFVMNSIKATFSGNSVADDDIDHRDLLLIDIDRANTSKEPANQEELEAAEILSQKISNYLNENGWGDPIKMLSGNGYHLYYILNKLTNDGIHTALIKNLLKELGNKFNNDVVKVDTVVYNASRITKVPGTIAFKGTASEERPYRMAKVLT